MQIPHQHQSQLPQPKPDDFDRQLRAIAYSLDVLVPCVYFWFGSLKLRVGGSLPEENYTGTIHSPIGIALVLPGYRIHSTYQGSYDPG